MGREKKEEVPLPFKYLSLAVAFEEQLTISCRPLHASQWIATPLKTSGLSFF